MALPAEKMTPRIGDLENCDAYEERAECSSSSGGHSCGTGPRAGHGTAAGTAAARNGTKL
jgi:hypothetical protein